MSVYLKNPFNYMGGKYKLLPQILPLFPDNISVFIDIFGGGGDVSLNVTADRVIYNDKSKPLVNIFRHLDDNFISDVESTITKWNLSKYNKAEFLNLRAYYNTNLSNSFNRESAVVLYTLIAHAFNNQMNFNSKYEFNTPSGYNRMYFSQSLKAKLKAYIDAVSKKNIVFENQDFYDIKFDNLSNTDGVFIYCDPPYLITTGSYEKDYFCKWSAEYEYKLLQFLDDLTTKNYKWALSNVLEHNGHINNILSQWCSKYNTHYLNANYHNCSYQKKDKSKGGTLEVLITNY